MLLVLAMLLGLSTSLLGSHAEASAACNSTQLVTSLIEMNAALDCARMDETSEIIIDSEIYISDQISILNISNLAIRGVTEDAALRYNNNVVRRRLLVITNSTVQLESLTLLGDSAMGCLELLGAQVVMQAVHVLPLPFVQNMYLINGLGAQVINSTLTMKDSLISGWKNVNSAGNGAGLHLVSGANVTLIRTTVSYNTVLMAGGGIYVSEGCTLLVLDNCVFESNSALTNGGAIHVQSNTQHTVFVVRDSLFFDNNSTSGGGVSVELTVADSAAVVFDFDNATFVQNNAHSFGGGLRLAAGGVITNSTCHLNEAHEAGGGFWLSGAYTLAASGLRVTHNHCLSDDDEVVIMGGGGMVEEEARFTCHGCLFDHNTADNGGGLMVFKHFASVDLQFTRFVLNSAVVGGAIMQDRAGTSRLTSCYFFSNSVTSSGGAVQNTFSAHLVISFCDFVNCTSTDELSRGGTLAAEEGRVTVTNSSIRGGVAGYGGGVFTSGTVLNLERSEIKDCHARRQGGAIEVSSFSELNIRQSQLTISTASQSGGGIFASATCIVTTLDSKFENLTSEANGGALYLEHNSKFSSEASTFRFNRAVDGGVIFLDHESETLLLKSLFDSNYALNGGVVALRSSMINSFNNIFSNNSAHIGGALSISTESVATSVDDFFVGNHVSDSGGCILMESSSFVNISRCVLKDSFANYGGAIKSGSEATFLISDSLFEDNEAGFAGGALNIESSARSDLVNVIFRRNRSQRGGSIVLGNSELSITHSDFHWSVGLYGGCVYAEDFSRIVVESSTFSDSHGLLGGVMYLMMSDANFTSSTFVHNSGVDGRMLSFFDSQYASFTGDASSGGVFSVTLSHLLLDNCLAVNNVAQYGGFMTIRYSTVESFNNTYFNNTAYDGGLVLISARSTLIFDSDQFRNNMAVGDGALVYGEGFGFLSFQNVMIDASNSVTNTPSTLVFLIDGVFDVQSAFFGNPLNTTRSTTLDLKHLVFNMNNTDFTNFYGSDVGAIVRVMEGTETNINACSFTNNRAEKYGGALAFAKSKNVSITNCSFYDNAAISGGAIYAQESAILVENCLFVRNKAFLGGGVLFWTQSDITYQNNQAYQNEALYGADLASTAQNLFIDNLDDFSEPQTSGSKILTPIQVVMHDFYGQTVRTSNYDSGVDSFVITASTSDLNSSISGSTIEVFNTQDGIALFRDLTVTLSPGNFVLLKFDAQGERGIASVEMGVRLRRCVKGEIEVRVTDTQSKCEMCPPGTYSFDPLDKECTECPRDATCDGGTNIRTDKGFWRQCQECEIIEECIFRDSCLGSANVSEQCASGNTGPLCNVCEDGYSRNSQGGCQKCGSIGVVVHTVVGVTFGLILVFIVVVYIFRKVIIKKLGMVFHRLEDRLDRMNWNKHRTKVKIIIAFIQITAGIPSLLSVDFHYAFNSFLDFMGYFTFGFFTAIDLGCYFQYNFYTALRISTLVPPTFMVFIDIFLKFKTFLAVRANSVSPSYSYKVRNVDRKRFFLYISFFVFSTISTQIFQTFVCEEFEDGKSYLVVDSNLECYTTQHKQNMVYAGFMIFLYPVGIPLYYAFHLYRKKKYINPSSSKVVRSDERHIISDDVIQQEKIKLRNTYKVLDGQQFLFDSYLPKCWYFEIVECFRRLSLTALPILFLRSSVVQIVLVLLSSLGFSALYMSLHPYEHHSDNTVAILSQWAVSMTVVGALCMKVNDDSENGDEFDRQLVAILLIIVNAMIFVFTIYASVQESDFTDDLDDLDDKTRESTMVNKPRISQFGDSDDEGEEHEDLKKNRTLANVKNVTSLDAFDKGVSRNKRIEQEKREEEAREEAKKMQRKERRSNKERRDQQKDQWEGGGGRGGRRGGGRGESSGVRRQSTMSSSSQRQGPGSTITTHNPLVPTESRRLSAPSAPMATVVGFEMSSTNNSSRVVDSDDEED